MWAAPVPDPEMGASIKAILEDGGVAFPAGSSISYSALRKGLTHVNTAENLQKAEGLMYAYGWLPIV